MHINWKSFFDYSESHGFRGILQASLSTENRSLAFRPEEENTRRAIRASRLSRRHLQRTPTLLPRTFTGIFDGQCYFGTWWFKSAQVFLNRCAGTVRWDFFHSMNGAEALNCERFCASDSALWGCFFGGALQSFKRLEQAPCSRNKNAKTF